MRQAKKELGDYVEKRSGKWNQQHNLVMMKDLEEWEVKSLNAESNRRENLLQDILHISFTRLAELNINLNHINSIEQICRVEIRQLKAFSMGRNFIRSARSLRKVHWPQLSVLHLYDNFIVDGEKLTEGFWAQLIRTAIDFSHTQQLHSLQFFMKLQTQNLRVVGTHEDRYRIQSSFLSMLTKKAKVLLP